MKIAVFSSKSYDEEFLKAHNKYNYSLSFFKEALTKETALLAKDHNALCCFVNDDLGKEVLEQLHEYNIHLIALRCTGFNNVDLKAAAQLKMTIVYVPAYSPNAVAEHAVCLMLSLNRKIYKAYNRVRDGNFSLESLLGFDFYGKTAGILGTGAIGTTLAKILKGFGMNLFGYDIQQNEECKKLGLEYKDLSEILEKSDILSLHLPLNTQTKHIINQKTIEKMKDSVMLINTGRGGLIDTKAAIDGLKLKKIGYLGLDVYEEEANLFFQNLSDQVIQDDEFARLLTFPNVIITSHQGYFTSNALTMIAETTMKNIYQIANNENCPNHILSCNF